MKKYLLFLLGCVSILRLAAQPHTAVANCASPLSCTTDLRDTLYSVVNIDTLTYSYAGSNKTPGFHDVSYADSTGCNRVTSCSSDKSILVYKVYYPSPRVFNYTDCRLPVIVLFHAGGFADCNGNYNTTDMKTVCNDFAQRGFIAISVNYRTGVRIVPGKYGNYYSAQQMLGIWRAVQDAKGAMRSIIRRERNAKEPYRADTNNLFVGGKSAGSVIAMNLAFYSKSNLLTTAFPGIGNSNILGSINQNDYYGSTVIDFKIKAVLDMWGGAIVPQTTDSSYLKSPEKFFFASGNTMPPLISFQGVKDKTFNSDYEVLNFAPANVASGLYSSESYCLLTATTYTPGTATNPNAWVLGAQKLYDMFKRKGIPTELYLDCDMGHGLDSTSDFGLRTPSVNDVNNYITQRACTFFQAVANGIAGSLTTTRFINCENYRHNCSVADNNNSCSNNGSCSIAVMPVYVKHTSDK